MSKSSKGTLGNQGDRDAERQRRNEAFLERLFVRRPEQRPDIEKRLRVAAERPSRLEGARPEAATGLAAYRGDLEAVVSEHRPVLFATAERDGVPGFDVNDVYAASAEAKLLIDEMQHSRLRLEGPLSSVGRIDLDGGGADWLATGWFFAESDGDWIVVTNRHVALRVAERRAGGYQFLRGAAGPIGVSLGMGHLAADERDAGVSHEIDRVLYIEDDNDPNDIAFLRVKRAPGMAPPTPIALAPVDAADAAKVCVIGYPAAASPRVIPNQELMRKLYRDKYNVKRLAPGYVFRTADGVTEHDCTTLGGNSGSAVVDLQTGKAVGLHYAGIYQDANFAVSASVLRDYKAQRKWNHAPEVRGVVSPAPVPPAPVPHAPVPPAQVEPGSLPSFTFQVPLHITVQVGMPVAVTIGGATTTVSSTTPLGHPTTAPTESVESAVLAYWDGKPAGVVAARVGYEDDGGQIGDRPCVAISVLPDRLSAFRDGEFHGFPLRFFPATAQEQFEARGLLEGAGEIRYDDDARQGLEFSFDAVHEEMEVIAHVGPEYSWETLQAFIGGTKRLLVSSMYEFHSLYVKDAIEERLDDSVRFTVVLDGKTFTDDEGAEDEFDRRRVFDRWSEKYKNRFSRVVVPLGSNGLVSSAYHIKVSVREDDTFWLSSGNWKAGSSQPRVDAEMRLLAKENEQDLPGNREWHVVVKNATLAGRFRSHILQDFKRSTELGGGPTPEERTEPEEESVNVVVDEALELERRAPDRFLEPLRVSRRVNVKPLLTPDREGEIYSEAVLELIRSAKRSLLFQIPYIGMPSNPRSRRGYIDDLIGALVEKLTTLEDARVLLRAGGSALSAPSHAAWYFKSKGVDIDARLRSIENHHTKGMIVDGKRVLIGSHNWSAPGVTLNRDASLVFDDAEIAKYFAQAFIIDWNRSNPIRPRKFVREGNESVGGGVLKRVKLGEVLGEGV